MTRTWLIGEFNPYQRIGADHTYALYPDPPNSSGGRLCHLILRMDPDTYVDTFERRNLLQDKWSMPRARESACRLMLESGHDPLVLCGAKVAGAFGLGYMPFNVVDCDGKKLAILPHPSGLNRAWHESGSFDRARTFIMSLVDQHVGVQER